MGPDFHDGNYVTYLIVGNIEPGNYSGGFLSGAAVPLVLIFSNFGAGPPTVSFGEYDMARFPPEAASAALMGRARNHTMLRFWLPLDRAMR